MMLYVLQEEMSKSELYFNITNSVSEIEKIIRVKPDVVINCIGILNKVVDEHKALAILINSYLLIT